MTEEEKYEAYIKECIATQRSYFAGGETRNILVRIERLCNLDRAIDKYEHEITDALRQDLGKSAEEAYLTEISIVKNEIKVHLHNLCKWAAPKKVHTPLFLSPSKSHIVYEPFGSVLILSPWNYPFQLLVAPLIGAVSAGNCVILKPSTLSPATNMVVAKIVGEVFSPEYVSIIEADAEKTMIILRQALDFIFFTGSPSFGKEVMRAAAANLTPVVLELGGKSPCIVDCGSNIEVAAKRIAWGKFLNAGQTCIAPDYLFVHSSIVQQVIESLKYYINEFYGEDPSVSPYYARIISRNALMRLKSYLSDGDIVMGGDADNDERYMSPTIMQNIKPGSAVTEDEIFGPILPVFTYEKLDEALEYINSRPKPLALYYFGKPATGDEVIRKTSSGGACINDVIMHVANHNLPFGGVGNSGMGKYHGKSSFRVFSNERSVLKSSTHIDMPLKYVPFRHFSVIKKLLG